MSKLSEGIAKVLGKNSVVNGCVVLAENAVKKTLFKCQDCGQCVLSHTGFTCPMRCPKQIRNGPCGGTRANGHCEVYPERHCIWWLINERSKKLGRWNKLRKYHIPVDRRFEHTSAWLNMFSGKILPMSLNKELKESDLDDIFKKKKG